MRVDRFCPPGWLIALLFALLIVTPHTVYAVSSPATAPTLQLSRVITDKLSIQFQLSRLSGKDRLRFRAEHISHTSRLAGDFTLDEASMYSVIKVIDSRNLEFYVLAGVRRANLDVRLRPKDGDIYHMRGGNTGIIANLEIHRSLRPQLSAAIHFDNTVYLGAVSDGHHRLGARLTYFPRDNMEIFGGLFGFLHYGHYDFFDGGYPDGNFDYWRDHHIFELDFSMRGYAIASGLLYRF